VDGASRPSDTPNLGSCHDELAEPHLGGLSGRASMANATWGRCTSVLLRGASGLEGCAGEPRPLLLLPAACTSAAPAAWSRGKVLDRCRCSICTFKTSRHTAVVRDCLGCC